MRNVFICEFAIWWRSAWIPLNALNEAGAMPKNISVSPQNTYRNKGECSLKRFDNRANATGLR